MRPAGRRARADGTNPERRKACQTTTLTQTQEQELLTRVNTARINGRQYGSRYYKPVSPVTWNTLLEAAAQRHSNDMTNNNWFSHYGSDGSSPWDRIREAGYSMLTQLCQFKMIISYNSNGYDIFR